MHCWVCMRPRHLSATAAQRLIPVSPADTAPVVCACMWGAATGMPADANAGRIWVESADSGRWRVLLRPQQLDQLKQVLEPRGAREGGLHAALLRVESAVRAAMPGQPFQMPASLGGSELCLEKGGPHSDVLLHEPWVLWHPAPLLFAQHAPHLSCTTLQHVLQLEFQLHMLTCACCMCVYVCVPADQLPVEQQQEAAAAQLRWLQQQPLLARLFTSRQQEDSILALTQQQAAAAAADAPNGAEVDMQPADGDGSSAAAAADLLVLKRNMLRVEALVAAALKVRLLLTSKYLRLHPAHE